MLIIPLVKLDKDKVSEYNFEVVHLPEIEARTFQDYEHNRKSRSQSPTQVA